MRYSMQAWVTANIEAHRQTEINKHVRIHVCPAGQVCEEWGHVCVPHHDREACVH